MKRITKRSLSIILSLVIVITTISIAFYASAVQRSVDINKRLLESVLNDRSWIINTLINGDYSDNPYSAVNYYSNETALMDEVIENYKSETAFKVLVDVMEYYSESGQYLSGLSDEVINKLLIQTGVDSIDNLILKLDKLSASTAELKYESILNGVLQNDYTASWGETLMDENMQLENLQQKVCRLKRLQTI